MAEYKLPYTAKQIEDRLEYVGNMMDSGGNANQGGGLTTAQITALDGMFKVCAYTEDVTEAYKAFKTAFGIADSGGSEEPDIPDIPDEPDEPEIVTYIITNTLTNVSNSNSAVSVNENASYTATLTADEGYELDSVTVTMGGDDITGSVYAYGGISISSVTGNIVITATAVETVVEDAEAYNWTSGEAYVIDEWTDGYQLTYSSDKTVETFTENSGYSYSEYLPCAGVSAFVASSSLYFNYVMDHVYDSNKNYMGYLAKGGADTTPFGGVTYLVMPIGAKYLRLTSGISSKASATVTPYKFDELTATTVPEGGKIYAVSMNGYKYINPSTGVEADHKEWSASDFMYCNGFTTFDLVDSNRKNATFYDADKNFISGLGNGFGNSGAIPDGAVYVRISEYAQRGTLIVLGKEESA